MTLTLGQLKNMEPVLHTISQSKVIDIKTAYKFAKFIKAVAQELAIMEEQRQRLVEKYGERLDDGSVKVIDNLLNDFLQEYEVLASTKVQFDFEPVELDVLKDINLSPQELIAIDPLIKQ